jgi:ABC-2 type transport system permease protein
MKTAAALSNPVMIKEVRTRMRGWRTFGLVTIHLLFLGGAIGLTYGIFSVSTDATSLNERRYLGQLLFYLVVGIEMVSLSFIAPALTAGALAQEHERQTYELLKVTLLSPRSLVLGKYNAALVFTLLMLLTGLPMLGPAFIIGGVQWQEIFISLLILLTVAVTYTAAGMFFSSLTSRTLFATVLSYAYAILNLFGLPLIIILISVALLPLTTRAMEEPSRITLALLTYVIWLLISFNPGASLIFSLVSFNEDRALWMVDLELTGQFNPTVPSPWLSFVVIHLLLSLFFLSVSIARVRRIDK